MTRVCHTNEKKHVFVTWYHSIYRMAETHTDHNSIASITGIYDWLASNISDVLWSLSKTLACTHHDWLIWLAVLPTFSLSTSLVSSRSSCLIGAFWATVEGWLVVHLMQVLVALITRTSQPYSFPSFSWFSVFPPSLWFQHRLTIKKEVVTDSRW